MTSTDGERVGLFYYPRTAVSSAAQAAESSTVRDGRIVEACSSSTGFPPPRAPAHEPMTQEQATLVERVRALLSHRTVTREVPMFGGRSFMVNDKMITHALKDGDLLVRVAPQRDGELAKLAGASRAEMGAGRVMGPGWISVSAAAVSGDEQLSFWIDAALEHNHASARNRKLT